MAWGDHEAQVLATLQSMRDQRFLTDLTIECCGKEFAAHRAILCASIPFFHVMYQSGMEEALSGKVNLQTISPEAMTIVLDFVYTGKVTSLGDDVQLFEDVIHATHLLQIDYLFKMYLESYKSMLTETHFARILTTTELYDNEELPFVFTYLAMNIYQISASDDFLQLTVSQMKMLLSHSELKDNCTDVVVQGILRWMKFDTEIRCTYLEDLFAFICVDEITLGYLQVLLNREPLIKNCQPLFNKLVSAVLSKLNEVCTDSELVCFERGSDYNEMTVYNLEKRTWSPAVELNFNLQSSMGVVEYLGHIYFFGGRTKRPFQPTATVYKFNPTLNEIVQLKDLCVPVNDPGVGVLNDQLYVVGGRAEQGDRRVITKTVQRVEPANGESSIVAATIKRHRSPFVLPFQNRLYIVGSSRDSSCAVECYTAHSDQWTVITSTPESVDRCQATLWNKQLVVLCNPYDNCVCFYDFTTDLWDWGDFPTVGPPSEKISGMWTTMCKRDKKPVILMQDSSSLLHIYDPDAESWETLPGEITEPWCGRISVFKS